MSRSVAEFAENVLGMPPGEIGRREVFIKFILARGRVVFDPELFARFEKIHGEGALHHEDIANAHGIPRREVQGGATAAISSGKVRIVGQSREFGGIAGRTAEVKAFFESRFDVPVIVGET
jgi:hypothetical protein